MKIEGALLADGGWICVSCEGSLTAVVIDVEDNDVCHFCGDMIEFRPKGGGFYAWTTPSPIEHMRDSVK